MTSYNICFSLQELFHLNYALKFHSCCFKWKDNLFMVHCIYKSQIFLAFHPLTDWQVVPMACLGMLVNNASINMGGPISLQATDLISLDKYSEVGLLDHIIVIFLLFWGTSYCFYTGGTNLHNHWWYARIPFAPDSCQHLLSFVIFIIVIKKEGGKTKQKKVCEVIAQYGFD